MRRTPTSPIRTILWLPVLCLLDLPAGMPEPAAAGTYCPEYVGSIAKEVATGDFNGDGLADFAVTVEPNAVAIVLGQAGPRPTLLLGSIPTGGAVHGIAAGDLNGDGFIDLVAGNPAGNYARLLLGHGDGSFTLGDPTESGTAPQRIALADFDADGDLDVVFQQGLVSGAAPAVTFRINAGDGTFGPGTTIEFPGFPNGSRDLAVGDLDGDGDEDIVVLGSGFAGGAIDTRYAILLANGDGSFAPHSIVAEDVATSAIALADVNGDGRADLVAKDGYAAIGGPPPNRLSVYFGQANGALAAPIFSLQTAIGLGGRLQLGDLNGDGALDAIMLGGPAFPLVEGCQPNRIGTAVGNGDGSFEAGSPPIEAGGAFSLGLAVGDANGDGVLDVATAGYECGTLVVSPGVGDGSLRVLANPARAYADKWSDLLRLNSSKPSWCVQFEPVAGSFDFASEGPFSLTLVSPGTGSVSQISSDRSKGVILGDADGNLVPDIRVCFRKSDLRLLFENVTGRQSLPVLVRGQVGRPGCVAEASLTIEVQGGGGNNAAARLWPASDGWTLSYRAERPGPAHLRLFDVTGRLVAARALPDARPGWNNTFLGGLDGAGRRLSSGIYFYRVEAGGEPLDGKFVIAR